MDFKVLLCFLLLSVWMVYAENGPNDEALNKNIAQDYLEKFGYTAQLGLGRNGNGNGNEAAIKRFQRFFHLKQTGKLDSATITEMRKPRCGNSDRQEGFLQFKTGSKWRKTALTYRFINTGNDLPAHQVRAIFKRAFGYWSAVTPLRFREVRGRSDFTILFARRNHNDGAPFDGPGGVLAHARLPTSGILHFDEDEQYSDNRRGIHLLSVAVHEIGHAIGLYHSNVRGSIMWPSYNGYEPNLRLHSDDIRGIQSLYGGGTGGSNCVDKNGQCPRWTAHCSTNNYVRQNCRKSCRLCGGERPNPRPSPGSNCVDKNGRCPRWTAHCSTNNYVRQNCRKSCRLCGGGRPGLCRDKNRSCPGWRRFCSSNRYVRANCPRTCGLCRG